MLSHMVIARAHFEAEKVNLVRASRSSCAYRAFGRRLNCFCAHLAGKVAEKVAGVARLSVRRKQS